MVKNSLASAGDPGSIPGSGRYPGGRSCNPLQYGQRSLAGYSLWGRKMSWRLNNNSILHLQEPPIAMFVCLFVCLF